MPAILLINPNTNPATTAMMVRIAQAHLAPGWTIRGVEAASGPRMILDPAALAASAAEVVRLGQANPADAVVVAAFGDPGVPALRSCLAAPVVGIAESAMREAAAQGRFGIATTTPSLAGAIRAAVAAHGLAFRFTGVRIPPDDPLHLAADPARQEAALADAVSACIAQDGAEAVVIGGGPLGDSASALRRRFATPIVEPVPAAIRAVMAALG